MENTRKNIITLISLSFTGAVAISLIRPVIPIFARRMGATGFEVGGLISGFMLARAITAYFCGKFSDKLGRRKIFIPVGFFAYFITCILFFLSRQYIYVLLLSIIQGAFSGGIWPIAQVMTIENSQPSFKTRALSFYFASGNAGMGVGNALLGVTIVFIMFLFKTDEDYAMRLVFLLSAMIYIIGFFLSFTVKDVKRTREKEPVSSSESKVIDNKKGLIGLIVLGFLIGVIMGIVRSIVVLYLNERFFISTKNIAFILMAMNISALVSMLFFSYMSDKKGIFKGLFIVILLTGISSLLMPFINSTFMFIVVLVVLGTGSRSFTPISRSTISELSGGHLGQNIGLINTVSSLGAVVGPLAGGLFYDHFQKPFLFVNLNISIFPLVGILIFISLFLLCRSFFTSPRASSL